MATNDVLKKNIEIGRYTDTKKLSEDLAKHIKSDNIVFLCIGTDRSTGDSLAPLIGTMLVENGYENVIGTLDDPVHAVNLNEKVSQIPSDKLIVAVDAALGKKTSIGKLALRKGKMYPGNSLGKDIAPVGDFHIVGVVNRDVRDIDINFQLLQNTRLSIVMKMAKTVVVSIEAAFPLKQELRRVK